MQLLDFKSSVTEQYDTLVFAVSQNEIEEGYNEHKVKHLSVPYFSVEEI